MFRTQVFVVVHHVSLPVEDPSTHVAREMVYVEVGASFLDESSNDRLSTFLACSIHRRRIAFLAKRLISNNVELLDIELAPALVAAEAILVAAHPKSAWLHNILLVSHCLIADGALFEVLRPPGAFEAHQLAAVGDCPRRNELLLAAGALKARGMVIAAARENEAFLAWSVANFARPQQ